jgi:uncharacterized protein (TIGR03435 family)
MFMLAINTGSALTPEVPTVQQSGPMTTARQHRFSFVDSARAIPSCALIAPEHDRRLAQRDRRYNPGSEDTPMTLRPAIVAFIGVLAASVWSPPAVGQANQASDDAALPPRFEVASVKVNKTGRAGEAISHMGMRPDGSFTALNTQVSGLVQVAYDYPIERIIGLPSWAAEDGFDVTAKTPTDPPPGGTPPARIMAMIRSLLADRFKLIAHVETRESAAYELRLARADGRLGPGLVRSEREDCAAMLAGRGRPPGTAIGDGSHPECGFATSFGSLAGGGIEMDQLARGPLTRFVGRPVLDRTGLTGTFDLALTFPFGETPSVLPLVQPGEPVPIDPNRPTIFTAIQEQLGLKLDSVRAPVDVLVIDRVERPDPD